jgi:hypothetical protein
MEEKRKTNYSKRQSKKQAGWTLGRQYRQAGRTRNEGEMPKESMGRQNTGRRQNTHKVSDQKTFRDVEIKHLLSFLLNKPGHFVIS